MPDLPEGPETGAIGHMYFGVPFGGFFGELPSEISPWTVEEQGAEIWDPEIPSP